LSKDYRKIFCECALRFGRQQRTTAQTQQEQEQEQSWSRRDKNVIITASTETIVRPNTGVRRLRESCAKTPQENFSW